VGQRDFSARGLPEPIRRQVRPAGLRGAERASIERLLNKARAQRLATGHAARAAPASGACGAAGCNGASSGEA